MNYGDSGLSASDVALISGNGRSGDGFGGENGSWWIIIFLIFALTGWGGRNNGGFGGGSGSGASDNYVLASDFATIQRQLSDGFTDLRTTGINLAGGIADLGYAQAQLINGVNTNVLNSTFGIQSSINNVANQIQSCCCEVQRGIDGVNYNMASNTNAITTNATMNTRDIIENQNANYRALHDEIVANRIEDKNAQIQMLQTKLNNAELRASQEAQSAYLLNELKPCPSAAYIVPNPNCCYNYTVTQNGSCGCGNF